MYTDRIQLDCIGRDAHGDILHLEQATIGDAHRTCEDLRSQGFRPTHVLRTGNSLTVSFSKNPNQAQCSRCWGLGLIPTSYHRAGNRCFACTESTPTDPVRPDAHAFP